MPSSGATEEAPSGEHDAETASPLKSLTYGALGLERPDLPEAPPNASYEAGQWVGAAGKIGTILSLLL